jgi:hypothetical protein
MNVSSGVGLRAAVLYPLMTGDGFLFLACISQHGWTGMPEGRGFSGGGKTRRPYVP